MLENFWAKVSATAMLLDVVPLLGVLCFLSIMFFMDDSLVQTCDSGVISVAPFTKATYLDYRHGYHAGRGFVIRNRSCSSLSLATMASGNHQLRTYRGMFYGWTSMGSQSR